MHVQDPNTTVGIKVGDGVVLLLESLPLVLFTTKSNGWFFLVMKFAASLLALLAGAYKLGSI